MFETTFIPKSNNPGVIQVEKMEATSKPMETPAAKPRNKNLIMIGIVIIVLIVVGVGVYAYVNTGSTPPQGTKFTMWDVGTVCSNATQCGFKDPSGNANTTITTGTTVYRPNTGKASHSSTSCDTTGVASGGRNCSPAPHHAHLPGVDTPHFAPHAKNQSLRR